MRLIIAGSRSCTHPSILKAALERYDLYPVAEVVSGTARGADKLGEKWATHNRIPVKKFPADWEKYGRSAGYKRNIEMAEYADALLALWDGRSRGTKHMIDIAKDKGLIVHVYFFTPEEESK